MINFNGVLFAKNEKELIESVFNPVKGSSASGIYKRNKSGYVLMKAGGDVFAFVRVGNDPLVMTCKRLENGKLWYSYASLFVREFLGLDQVPPNKWRECIESIK
jgi:hypothetical protein